MRDDIISRLRELAKPGTSLEDVGGASVFTEAAAEIASLRLAIRRLAEQDATLSVQDGNVTVTMDATLTDAEREAIGWAAGQANLFPEFEAIRGHADALRAMLERTK